MDPGFSFVFLGTYQRLARCWALAVSGEEPDTATTVIPEAQRLIAANLLDPPRSCVATWYALLCEMHLAAGSTDDAAIALDRADFYLNAYGRALPGRDCSCCCERNCCKTQGAPVAVVRAAAELARSLSNDREKRDCSRTAPMSFSTNSIDYERFALMRRPSNPLGVHSL